MKKFHDKKKSLVLSSVAGLGIWAMFSMGQAATPVDAQVPEADVRPDTEIVAEQYLLLGNATRGSGESQVAVNPLNPNQIAVAGMSVIHNNDGKFEHNDFEFRRTDRAVLTYFATSRDRGLTWRIVEDPMRDHFDRYRCLDPFTDFAKDGTLIMGCEAHFPVNADPLEQADAALNKNTVGNWGGVNIVMSKDGGITWGKPIEIMNSWLPKEAMGPYTAQTADSPPGDAPKIRVDRSNGKITMMGRISGSDPARSTKMLRTSKDNGRSWGMVYVMDDPEWLSSGAGSSSQSNHDASNGVLAVSYIASKVPVVVAAALNLKCPCLVFATSKDDGKTFERHVVPYKGDRPNGTVFADASKPGHYTVLSQNGMNVEAYTTEDSGVTWRAPVVIVKATGTSVSDVFARYNDVGELGLSWRVNYHDPKDPVVRGGLGGGGAGGAHVFVSQVDTSEIWSALSRDGGKTFSAPLKVSAAPSPGISRRRGNQNHSADYNSVNIDHDFVHISWWDNRSGFLGTWYGRVPLKDYK